MFKKLDLFSSSFLFNIAYKQDAKKTAFGALLAIFIFSISLGYLGYLASQYFQNQILPKISTQDTVPTSVTFNIDKKQFVFTVMMNNMPHRAYAQLMGKNYIRYKIEFIEGQENSSTPKMTLVNVVQCQDELYKDYDCIDLNDQTSTISMRSVGQIVVANSYVIWVYPCNTLTDNCALMSAITPVLSHPANHFYFSGRIDQYDVTSLSFKNIYINHIYQLSQSLMIFSNIQTQTNLFEITQGPFVQTSETHEKIKGYKRVDSYFTSTDTIGSSGAVVAIVIAADQNVTKTNIQFPQITEVIAQFSGILNVLLALGFLGRMVSKSQLFTDIKNIVIKNTFLNKYKQPLAQKQVELIDMVRIHPQNLETSEQKLISSISSFQNAENAEQMLLKSLDKADQDKLVEYFNNKTEKVLNISQLLADFLFLQRSIRVLLTKEQYVALKYCGQEIDLNLIQKVSNTHQKQESEGQLQNIDVQTPEAEKLQEYDIEGTPQLISKKGLLPEKNIELSGSQLLMQNINNKQIQKSNFQPQQLSKQQINYLSEIDEIDQNQEEQQRIFKTYLKQLQHNQLTPIDSRIYSCLPQ